MALPRAAESCGQEMSMATTYHGALTSGSIARSKPGFAARVLQRYIEGRKREASRQIADYLRNFDDASLESMGYSKMQITKLRRSDSCSPFIL